MKKDIFHIYSWHARIWRSGWWGRGGAERGIISRKYEKIDGIFCEKIHFSCLSMTFVMPECGGAVGGGWGGGYIRENTNKIIRFFVKKTFFVSIHDAVMPECIWNACVQWQLCLYPRARAISRKFTATGWWQPSLFLWRIAHWIDLTRGGEGEVCRQDKYSAIFQPWDNEKDIFCATLTRS